MISWVKVSVFTIQFVYFIVGNLGNFYLELAVSRLWKNCHIQVISVNIILSSPKMPQAALLGIRMLPKGIIFSTLSVSRSVVILRKNVKIIEINKNFLTKARKPQLQSCPYVASTWKATTEFGGFNVYVMQLANILSFSLYNLEKYLVPGTKQVP